MGQDVRLDASCGEDRCTGDSTHRLRHNIDALPLTFARKRPRRGPRQPPPSADHQRRSRGRGKSDEPRRHGHAKLRIPSCRGEFRVQDTRNAHTQMPTQREKMRPANALFFLTGRQRDRSGNEWNVKERQRTQNTDHANAPPLRAPALHQPSHC